MKKLLIIYTFATALTLAAPPAPSSTPKTNHWAFQPVTTPQIPEVSNPSWIRTPIDAFILAKLDAAGLQPAAPADSRTLLRRLSYYLTGLPPNFEQTQSCKDPPTAIEPLLASPHFGERWARQWLDVARYSDTKGYAYSPEEFTFVHAWLYRDWVVKALNDDLPFDQFLIRQLAADRLLEREECDQSDLAAMGFLTLGRRFLGVQQDIIDDRIDTITRGMLGLTVSCSRCHDHKYDPIPTSDYYALYAILNSSHDKMIALKESDDSVLKERREQLAAEFEKHASSVEKRHLERVGEYLIATLDMSIVPAPDFAELFTKEDLNPAQIRRWNEYLSLSDMENHQIFAPWVALTKIPAAEFSGKAAAALKSIPNLDPVIMNSFSETPLRNKQDLAIRYAKILKANAQHPAIAKIISGPGSPLAIPRNRHLHDIEWFFADAERNSLKTKLAELERRIYQLGNDAPHAITMADQPVPQNTHTLLRGNYSTPGEEVTRRALGIFGGAKFTDGSGRLELAQLIAAKDNPLTARLIVNRLWQHHFGTGIVNTPSDFGLRAETPSHPKLLDFLASELIKNNWSLKSIHRLITQSAVYHQASTPPTSTASSIDPENRLLSFFPRRPIDFESMRDSLLVASGELDRSIGGKPGALFGTSATLRRSLYGRIDRQFLPNTLRVFDFANPELHSPQRHLTNIPQQALFFMNSPFVEDRAIAFAKRFAKGSTDERITRSFQIAFQRNPTENELRNSREFITEVLSIDSVEKNQSQSIKPSSWHYGYGQFNEQSGKLDNFTSLPYFTGQAWCGSENWPDAKLGWLRITATGGHAGNGLHHAAVRRWVSPIDGRIKIRGSIQNDDDCGDGVRAIITSSRHGTLQNSIVKFGETSESKLDTIEIAKGDAIDFVVDCGPDGNFYCDQFVWTPIVQSTDGKIWNAKQQFGGKITKPKYQLDSWERFAHSLLLTNTFMFID